MQSTASETLITSLWRSSFYR